MVGGEVSVAPNHTSWRQLTILAMVSNSVQHPVVEAYKHPKHGLFIRFAVLY